MTALHAAVYTKGVVSSLGLAVLLIEAGADVDLKDKVSPDMHGYGDHNG